MRNLTPPDVARDLAALGFPKIFCQIVLNQHKKYDGFDIYFGSPWEFYRLLNEQPEDFPFAQTILPLHESNCDWFVCYIPPPTGLFIEHSIEWKPSDYKVVAKSLREYIDYEVRQLCDKSLDPDELRTFGTLLGHPEIERIVADYEQSS